MSKGRIINAGAAALAAALLSLTSCDSKKVYDTYEHTPIAGWEKSDLLSFSIPKVATSGTYSTDLGLRVNESYPFMSVTLIVEQHILPSDKTVTDTLKCSLIDEKGNTTGQGVNLYQYRFHVSDLPLQAGDSLQVKVRHDMKREILPGISDVGIRLSLR